MGNVKIKIMHMNNINQVQEHKFIAFFSIKINSI